MTVAAPRSMSERLLPYLRLVRAPAVFSVIGDPLAGMLIASGRLSGMRAVTLGAAAGATYLSGMALNDLADREEDARERPHRPIPSGDVPVRHAALLGGALLLSGATLASRRGAGATGAALAGAVLTYNFGGKSTPAGPVVMGFCRSLSLLTGAEAAGGWQGVCRAAGASAILGGYVAGLTIVAQGETEEEGRNRTLLPGVLLGGAAVAAAMIRGGPRARPWGVLTAALAGPAVMRAVRNPSPSTVGPAVGAMIRAIPALDAALAAPRAPMRTALIAAPLLGLTRWGRKLIPIS